MDECLAWLHQALADRAAADWLASNKGSLSPCHVIAKCQQTVEKAIKALVAALRDDGTLHIVIGREHGVERFFGVLLRLPRVASNRTVQQHLRGLLDNPTRQGISALDALAPRWPPPGELPRRNTEYPFQNEAGDWAYPAAEDVFSDGEIQRFRSLAHRISDGASRIVFMVRRRP
jgi:HEPN domain-containing protein